MKSRIKVAITICSVVVLAGVAALVAVLGKMSDTVAELSVESTKRTADAVLASAELHDKTAVSVPVLFYDQHEDSCEGIYDANTHSAAGRQFEWSGCGYNNFAMEQEIVAGELDKEYLPVAEGGEALTNRGVVGDGFQRWFHTVEGKSKAYGSSLTLSYDEKTVSFRYNNNQFYPLDKFDTEGGGWSPREESVNRDGHNHLFTMSLGVPIQVLANGSEKFEVTADDDTWVYINNRLVIDMGGVHESVRGSFEIRGSGEVYAEVGNGGLAYSGVTLAGNDAAVVRVYHADRDSASSKFRMEFINMVPDIIEATLAKSGSESTQIAYDPSKPEYQAPLGKSLTVHPSRVGAFQTATIVQGLVAAVISVLIIVTIMVWVRVWMKRER